MQSLAFGFQNTLQHNGSAHKNNTNQGSNARRKSKLQSQCHSEKGRNTTTKINALNLHLFENCSHVAVQVDNN